jgi:uncharacterized repeat protein (TIGR03943 family)
VTTDATTTATTPNSATATAEPGVRRQAHALIMLLLGGAVIRVAVTGAYLRYVKTALGPLLILAGVLLILTAVMTLWYDLRGQRDHHDDEPAAGHGDHHEPRVGWLLVLPVIGLILVAPPALGSYSAAQSGSVLAGQGAGSDYAALKPGNPVSITLLDYASRAVYDNGRTLTGRHAQPMLARIVVSCCAADGRPVKVGLAGSLPTGIPAGTWINAVGTYTAQTAKDPVNDAAVPYLQVTTWQQIAEPAQPYE